MDPQTHWEGVYRAKRVDEVSWYQRQATLSLDLIRRAAPEPSARIIDVGGGASTLVDGLLDVGYTNVTVLDVCGTALASARTRLGGRASGVQWLDKDVRTAALPEAHFDLWHDRAVFHFLTNETDRSAYLAQVRRALRPGGHVLVATFADDGPTSCSGLPVVRYSATELHDTFGASFQLVTSVREQHVTPRGTRQSFVYCLCRFAPHRRRKVA
jgi:ubiquinone/menaquinone biosynthesis C-methylase UbiE